MKKKQTSPGTRLTKGFLKSSNFKYLILFSFSLVIFNTGCEKPYTFYFDQSTENTDTLGFDIHLPFASLNPVEGMYTGSNYVFPFLYSFLFIPDLDGQLKPDLAVRWTYDPSDFSWKIHLRKNARFHNNLKVESKDVKYSVELLLKKYHPNLFSMIKQISILSDTAICISLKKNSPEFLIKKLVISIIPENKKGKMDIF